MAKFKCVHSGTIIEFNQEHDIKEMRKHSEYVEVVEAVEPPVSKKAPTPVKAPVKKVTEDKED